MFCEKSLHEGRCCLTWKRQASRFPALSISHVTTGQNRRISDLFFSLLSKWLRFNVKYQWFTYVQKSSSSLWVQPVWTALTQQSHMISVKWGAQGGMRSERRLNMEPSQLCSLVTQQSVLKAEREPPVPSVLTDDTLLLKISVCLPESLPVVLISRSAERLQKLGHQWSDWTS